MAEVSHATRRRATLIGSGAVGMWATLALATTLAGPIPPFQMTAMAFAIAALLGFAVAITSGRSVTRALRQPWQAWGLGIAGLFGYHALYFVALQLAPPVEANLLNYLWPLLIVLFAGLLPGERLGLAQLGGALLGLTGTALLILRSEGLSLSGDALPGYLAALGCAVTWAAYSVLSRRFGHVPTDAVAGFCAATAVLAGLCHLMFETTAGPDGVTAWLAILWLGLGPVGGAFYVWDHGVKRGAIQVLGAISYAAPLASTLLLVLAGQAAAGWAVWAACALIIGGAGLASSGLAGSRRSAPAGRSDDRAEERAAET